MGAAAGIIGGSVVSGLLGKKSSDKARKSSDRAAMASLAEQKRQYDLGRNDLAPYREAGTNALSQYQAGISPNTNMYGAFQNDSQVPQYQNQIGAPPEYQNTAGAPPEFSDRSRFSWDTNALENDPGYQFTRDQALQSTQRQQNAGGNQFSGNILAALQDRAGGLAASYGQQFRNSALNESNTNYGRSMGEYGADTARNQDIYGRGVTDYGINNARNQDMYGRGVTDYGLAAQGNQQQYARDLGQYGLDVSRNTDSYNRDQNYLGQLAGLAGSGQNAATTSGGLGANYANAATNTMMGNAANTGSLAMQGANSLNSAVQGGIGNYLTYDYLQNNPTRPFR